jgi:hypothetical protein
MTGSRHRTRRDACEIMEILLEQLVYGSFPFWGRGYDVLARSPGCRAEWVADVLAACRKLGEAPSGLTPASALFAQRLPSGPWAVVGVEPQGSDDRGRPGALAFHALLVAPDDYRKTGANPFAFAGTLRRDWTPETTLTAVFCSVEKARPAPSTDPRTRRIVEALARRRRVAIESAVPIEALVREVWPSLPKSTRRRASVATWAFGNANRFDLVGLPRLAGVELDSTYLEPGAIDLEPAEPARKPWRLARGVLPWIYFILTLIPIPTGLIWWSWNRPDPPSTQNAPRSIEIDASLGPQERAKILAGLETLADRFELGGSNDPGSLMTRLADQLHYRGPTLTPAELARLATDPDPDRNRALEWHERIIRTFAGNRPLPDDFASLPLDRQLDRLAWSFHLDPRPPVVAIPGVLLQTLSRTGPIRPTPLASRYPALSDYARFLGKLPRLE